MTKEVEKEPNLFYQFIGIIRDFEGLANTLVTDPDKFDNLKGRSLRLRTKVLSILMEFA
ncbi:hypothetical protein HYT59_00590 [Candidatus Woesebacteria bacterium]|nr:hypothetical protein [Candidatus Woesebacteria bacterium]